MPTAVDQRMDLGIWIKDSLFSPNSLTAAPLPPAAKRSP